jgi:alpha-glucuronidase
VNEPIRDKGYAGWLRYESIEDEKVKQIYSNWCSMLSVTGQSGCLQTAKQELITGLQAMLGVQPSDWHDSTSNHLGRIVLGVAGSSPLIDQALAWSNHGASDSDGYAILSGTDEQGRYLALAGFTERGALYAVFHFLKLLQTRKELEGLAIQEIPRNGLRMINQWDNMDGSIERGYAGKSIFYENNRIVEDVTRVRDYARLLASVGMNAISINNVNVHQWETKLITNQGLTDVKRMAEVFRGYGIRLYLSINFASPIEIGGLTTADPLDLDVAKWWRARAEEIYSQIPDFGGFLVKADSEFRPGPFTYGRNHADGANMLAEAIGPYGGTVIWRCFVYNCLQDWRDRSTDRAKAAYDHFMPLDGEFKDNVILQIKNGPMDFQVREPVSPLFGGLTRTNQVLELQITQEYTGQQRHLCYLVPQWKEVLDYDTYALGEGSSVASTASGSLFKRPLGGMAAVSNIGNDSNWTGHDLAQANLFGFGRLAWNPSLSAEDIAKEWIQMTFSCDSEVEATLLRMLMDSRDIYESYTAPLGVGWMVNPNHHYGPNVDGYEYAKWGTYHFADCKGIGVDRTLSSGTGYSAQYHSPQSNVYESLDSCPDELLLFFHHVPYTHRLKSGKTVIQHIYDAHFEGAEQAEALLNKWDLLAAKIDTLRHERVRYRLVDQAEHAKEWRDAINTYFYRKSGIKDEHHRMIY